MITNAGGEDAIKSAIRNHSSNFGVYEKGNEALRILQRISTTTNAAHPSFPTTLTPSSHNPTELISIGQSKMKEAIDNVKSRPTELPVEFITYCTNNFDKDRKLGEGAFGAVYKGMDDNRYFAVKCLRFNLAFLEDQKKGISKSFIKELEVSSSVVSSIACSFKFLHFSFFHHTVSGIKEVPTQSYCNFVRLSFVPCFI